MGYGDFNINLPDGENFAPEKERVREIMAMMLDAPFHFGVSAGDRKAWERIGQTEYGKQILREAKDAVGLEPLPVVTDEIHLACWENDSPAAMNAVAPVMRARMALLPLAECIEPNGQYLNIIEDDIRAVLKLKSWLHPNNDQAKEIFEGKTFFADLATFHFASNLVAADFLLGDRLNQALRESIRSEIERRVFQPFRERIESGKDVYWWVTVTHNWNSVCLAELLGCALWLLEDLDDRAWYVALVEKLIAYSEIGFTKSGFYTEGVGYWGYGFGHYVKITELIRAVTQGKIDWFEKPIVQSISKFGARMEIQSGCYPTFADCARDVKPAPWLVNWLNNRLDDKRTDRKTNTKIDSFENIHFQFSNLLQLLLFHQVDITNAYEGEFGQTNREWFDDVQFLICRSDVSSKNQVAATFKGGHNGVNHNHNDLGTFTVLLNHEEVLTDPGGEVYTTRTFSKDRYDGDLLNSFGHPVPKVAGQLQIPGEDAHAVLLSEKFHDEFDEVVLDLKPAYQVPALERLERTFHYQRQGDVRVDVSDVFVFENPSTFETALITYAKWVVCDDGSVLVGEGNKTLKVTVASDHGNLIFEHCIIQESSTPTRLSWHFEKPVKEGKVSISVSVWEPTRS